MTPTEWNTRAAARSASSKEAEIARDAARYRRLRERGCNVWGLDLGMRSHTALDELIDTHDAGKQRATLSADRENPVAQDDGKEGG